MSRIYLDAAIIIYIVEKHPLYSSKLETVLSRLDVEALFYSPLTRLECLVMPFRTKDLPLQNLYEAFFNAQKILAMSEAIFDEAAKLRADFPSLKNPDALHLATAVYYDCDEFWTNDNRLERVNPGLIKNILTI